MKRFCIALLFLCLSYSPALSDQVVIKNSLSSSVELRVFSEKEMKWLKPAMKLEKGKSLKWQVVYPGDHNFKLIVGGKEFLLGTFDVQKAIKDNKIDTIELVGKAVAGKGQAAGGSGKKFRMETRTRKVAVTKMRTETRTREVTRKKADGTTETMTQEYQVQVPYTETVERQYQVRVPIDGASDKPKKVETKIDKSKFRLETRTRTVNIQKVRAETRTRMVVVTKTDGSKETVPQTYTVQVPYTEQVQQTYQVKVPIDGGKPIEVKKASPGAKMNYRLQFQSGGKVVKVGESFQRK